MNKFSQSSHSLVMQVMFLNKGATAKEILKEANQSGLGLDLSRDIYPMLHSYVNRGWAYSHKGKYFLKEPVKDADSTQTTKHRIE